MASTNDEIPSTNEVASPPDVPSSWSSYLMSKAKSNVDAAYSSVLPGNEPLNWQEMQSQVSSVAKTIGETGRATLASSKEAIDYISQKETYEKVGEWAYDNRKELVMGAVVVGTVAVMPGVAISFAKPIVVGAVGSRLNDLLNKQNPKTMTESDDSSHTPTTSQQHKL